MNFMKKSILTLILICSTIFTFGQKSVFLIIDTLIHPPEYDILFSDWVINLGGNLEEKKCLTKEGMEIISHDSRYWIPLSLREKWEQSICFEYKLKNDADSIFFPIDNKEGTIAFTNLQEHDTIYIPKFRIIKNLIPDSTFIIEEYYGINKEGLTGEFKKRKVYWKTSKKKKELIDKNIEININGTDYKIALTEKTTEQHSTFSGYRYRQRKFLHKLLGLKQMKMGGVAVVRKKNYSGRVKL